MKLITPGKDIWLKDFYFYFSNCAMSCILISILLYPHSPHSHSFESLIMVFSSTFHTLLSFMYILHLYAKAQDHANFPKKEV